MRRAPQVVVIGVGSPFRRDDAAGLEVVSRLRGRVPAGVTLHHCAGDLSGLLSLWEGADHAIVVDAMRCTHDPGTIHELTPAALGARPSGWYSTHAFGVAETLQMAEVLGNRPPRVDLYGIEVGDIGYGEGLSPEVRQAVDLLSELLVVRAAMATERAVAPSTA